MRHFIKKLFKHKKNVDTLTQIGPIKFIWGVKASDDLTTSEPNLYTMNDLDICYEETTQLYILGLETSYQFENRVIKERYLITLLDSFWKYLVANSLFDVSFDPINLYLYNNGNLFEATTLTELYYKFKLFVHGFMSV